MLGKQYLDYSIIDGNSQRHLDIEKIREILNEEFEFKGPSLSFVGLKRTLSSFMKQEHCRSKHMWQNNLDCEPSRCCDSVA